MRLNPLVFVLALAPFLVGCGGSGGGSMDAAPGPSLSAVSPSAGFAVGGQEVELKGTNLSAASEVTFNGVAAPFQVVDDTTLRATTPPGVAGRASVAVMTPDGTASQSLYAYVAYPPTAAPDIQIDNDLGPEGGQPWNGTTPVICCEGAVIYVVWADARADTVNFDSDVFFQRSTDGGITWAPEDIRLNTNDVGASDAIFPSICCDGDHIYVLWEDDRGGRPEPYMRHSSDGGLTWSASDVRIPQDAPNQWQQGPSQLHCSGSTLHVVWPRQAIGVRARELVYQRTTDGGLTWLPSEVPLAEITPAETLTLVAPVLCYGAGVLHVVWTDNRRGNYDIWHTRSTDDGLTWSSNQRVDQDTTDRNAGASDARLNACCDGETLYVIWGDDRDAASARGPNDLYFNRSTDGGATFGASDVRVNALEFSGVNQIRPRRPQICASGDTVHVIWEDNRPVAPAMTQGPDNHYAQRSTDGGLTWQATDAPLPTQPAGSTIQQWTTRVCCSGDYLHVAYVRQTGEFSDVHIVTSTDGGMTWPAQTVNLDSNNPTQGVTGMNYIGHPSLCCDGARPFVVWLDSRNAMDPAGAFEGNIFIGTYK